MWCRYACNATVLNRQGKAVGVSYHYSNSQENDSACSCAWRVTRCFQLFLDAIQVNKTKFGKL